MAIATNLGYPRIGPRRELKWALEQYWAGKTPRADLERTVQTLRTNQWQLQQQRGIAHIPSNDFALYDTVLDTIALVGAVPARFGGVNTAVDWDYDVCPRPRHRPAAQRQSTPEWRAQGCGDGDDQVV